MLSIISKGRCHLCAVPSKREEGQILLKQPCVFCRLQVMHQTIGSLTMYSAKDKSGQLEEIHTTESPCTAEGAVHKAETQLDQHGFPLIPQPSNFKDDPLVFHLYVNCWNRLTTAQNWPLWTKWMVLIQVSLLAFLGPFNSSVINPAFIVLAKHFSISSQEASYQTTTAIIAAGIFPIFYTPVANVYGRRPVYLLATLVGIIASVCGAIAPTWSSLLVTRAIAGGATSVAMALGAATVNDIFFLHEVCASPCDYHYIVGSLSALERCKDGRLDRFSTEYVCS